MAPARPRELTVERGPVPLAALDYGGDGPPAVFVHGGGCTAAHWHMTVTALGDAVRAISVDLRGHGASGAVGSWAFDDGVDDVRAVVEELAIDRPIVIGHSLGGMVATVYAATHGGCRGVVNVDGHGAGYPSQFPGIDTDELAAMFERAEAESVAGFRSVPDEGDKAWVDGELEQTRAFVEQVGVDWAAAEPLLRRGYREVGDDRWQRSPTAAVNSSMYLSLRTVDLRPHYAALSCPALVLRTNTETTDDADLARFLAAFDTGLTAQLDAAVAASPATTVEHFDCGHMVPLERPTELAARLATFIGCLR